MCGSSSARAQKSHRHIGFLWCLKNMSDMHQLLLSPQPRLMGLPWSRLIGFNGGWGCSVNMNAAFRARRVYVVLTRPPTV